MGPQQTISKRETTAHLSGGLLFACAESIFYSLRLPTVGTLKRYSKALKYEYRVKSVALGTLKRYSILSLTLYLELYCAYSILNSGGPTS
jgi:hypothetical protein